MRIGQGFTIAGLSFDLLGACLLFFFGFPEWEDKVAGISFQGRSAIQYGNTPPNESHMSRLNLYRRFGRVGFASIILGSILQIIGSALG